MVSHPSPPTKQQRETPLLVADSCILINFLRLKSFPVLTEACTFRLVITRSVLKEITDPAQRTMLDTLLEAGALKMVDPDSIDVVNLHLSIRQTGLGEGEASSLAYAATEGCILACDEKNRCFITAAERIGILDRLVTTRDLLNLAVIEERLSLEQANLLIAELGKKHRYHCRKLSSNDSLPAVLIPV